MLEKFLGNLETVKALSDWLEGWYHKSCYEPPYVLLFSSSGNGKTFLVNLFAQEMNLDLQTIDADDITSQEEMNNVIKSLNLRKFSGRQKMILVENYDEIKKEIQEVWKISNYPIIYTTYKYPRSDVDFKHGGLFLTLEKPLPYHITKLMEEELQKFNLTLPKELIEKIANESTSVRSALNSCLTKSLNESLKSFVSIYKKIEQLSKRGLHNDINEFELKEFFNAIQGFDDLEVRERFCQLNLMFKQMWKEEVDCLLLNKMREPLEKVEFEYKKKKETKKESKVEKTEHKKVEPPPSIENFF